MTSLTGEEVKGAAIAAKLEEFGAQQMFADIQGEGPEADRKRALLRNRAELADTLRGVREKVDMEGKSFKEMLYTDGGEGKARSLDWFKNKDASAAELKAIEEAQKLKGDDSGWLDMEGLGKAGLTPVVDDMAASGARTPTQVAGGGDMTLKADIMQLTINGKPMGPADLTGQVAGTGDADMAAGGTA